MKPIDAKSRDGITIGLIDAMLAIVHTLNERLAAEVKRLGKDPDDDHAWHSVPVQDALLDLAGNKALRKLLWPRDEKAMDIIHRSAELIRTQGINPPASG